MSSSLTSFSNLSKAFYACRRPDVETPRLHVAGENLMKAYYIINWIVSGQTRRRDGETGKGDYLSQIYERKIFC